MATGLDELKNNNDIPEMVEDCYFVGDSLSVGITNGYESFDSSVKESMQTSWMLQQVEQNKDTIAQKKVLFFLGGTNDVASGASISNTIANIDAIANIAQELGVKFVPATIPPISKHPQKQQIDEKIQEINNHIQSNYPNALDYHTLLAEGNDLAKKYDAGDGVHPNSAGYSVMRAEQQRYYESFKDEVSYPDIVTSQSLQTFPQTSEVLDETSSQRAEISDERLSTMTPENFLGLSKDLRISCVTEPSVTTQEIISGQENQIHIDFHYAGVLNKELQRKVTAGQVLSDKISQVEKNGVVYMRKGLEGEFFDTSNKRLTILTGDTLSTPTILSEPEYTEKTEHYEEEYNNFLLAHPEYSEDRFKDVILEILKRDIEPEFGMILLKRRIPDFIQTSEFKDMKQIQYILTDLGRSFNGVELIKEENGKYSLESATKIGHYLYPASVEELLHDYGYSEESITSSLEQNPDPISYKVDSPDNYYAPAEYTSYGVEYTDSGTTACARTTFKNMKRLGIDVARGHAHELMDTFKKQGKLQSFPPSGDYDFADLFLDSSQAKYKHRVACYRSKTDGQWYVLDPYYRIDLKNRSRTDPMPWLQYKKYMDGRGQKFHGAVMY